MTDPKQEPKGKQVAHILAGTSECRHEHAGIPDPQDEFGRDAQYPAHVVCPDCGADVEVR